VSPLPSGHDIRLDSPWSLDERNGLILLMAMLPAVLVLDFVAGRGISLHLFYVVPVGIAAWNLGARTGYVIAVAAAVSWAFVAIASRAPYDSVLVVAWDVLSTLALYLFMAWLVARHRRFVDGLLASARVDNESGALSRREFDRIFEAEVRRSHRYRRPLALVLLDLGESRGEGRAYFSAVVRSLQPSMRECDCIARIAPRRFAALLVECRSPEPMLVVERLREGLVANLHLRKHELAIAVVAYGGSQPESGATLMALAEKYALLARSGGGTGIAETRVD
jgi:GGDEF domain-containing protein